MSRPLAIVGGRIVDPAAGTVRGGGVLVRDRRIAAVGTIDLPSDAERIDARGALIAPGIVDLGSFAIDLPAFTAGGITRAALMPDQAPPRPARRGRRQAGRLDPPDRRCDPRLGR